MHIFIKMKKDLSQIIEIPENVEVILEDQTIIVKGPEGENKREFRVAQITLEKKDNKIILKSKKTTKNEKKMINTMRAHIKNMIEGVQKKFEYELKICFSHFPMNVEIKEDHAIVKNFLGEKIPRKLKIPQGVDIKIDKGIITVTSSNKELAGQAAANFEKATRIRMKDRRVFQDGIFMINKAGKKM